MIGKGAALAAKSKAPVGELLYPVGGISFYKSRKITMVPYLGQRNDTYRVVTSSSRLCLLSQ